MLGDLALAVSTASGGALAGGGLFCSTWPICGGENGRIAKP